MVAEDEGRGDGEGDVEQFALRSIFSKMLNIAMLLARLATMPAAASSFIPRWRPTASSAPPKVRVIHLTIGKAPMSTVAICPHISSPSSSGTLPPSSAGTTILSKRGKWDAGLVFEYRDGGEDGDQDRDRRAEDVEAVYHLLRLEPEPMQMSRRLL